MTNNHQSVWVTSNKQPKGQTTTMHLKAMQQSKHMNDEQ